MNIRVGPGCTTPASLQEGTERVLHLRKRHKLCDGYLEAVLYHHWQQPQCELDSGGSVQRHDSIQYWDRTGWRYISSSRMM